MYIWLAQAVGTHPTGMLSCFLRSLSLLNMSIKLESVSLLLSLQYKRMLKVSSHLTIPVAIF